LPIDPVRRQAPARGRKRPQVRPAILGGLAGDELAETPGCQPAPRPATVLGVDACPAGWIGIVLDHGLCRQLSGSTGRVAARQPVARWVGNLDPEELVEEHGVPETALAEVRRVILRSAHSTALARLDEGRPLLPLITEIRDYYSAYRNDTLVGTEGQQLGYLLRLWELAGGLEPPTCCLQDSSGSSTECCRVPSLQLRSGGSSGQSAPDRPSSTRWNDKQNDMRRIPTR
jgi:hypothetical protein